MGFLVLFQFTSNSSSHATLKPNPKHQPCAAEGLGVPLSSGDRTSAARPQLRAAPQDGRAWGPPVSAKVLRGIV